MTAHVAHAAAAPRLARPLFVPIERTGPAIWGCVGCLSDATLFVHLHSEERSCFSICSSERCAAWVLASDHECFT